MTKIWALREGLFFSLLALGMAGSSPAQGTTGWKAEFGYFESIDVGDHKETVISGGLRITSSDGSIELRADRALILADRQKLVALVRNPGKQDGIPRRGIHLPPLRSKLNEEVLRDRLNSFLAASGRVRGSDRESHPGFPLDLAHSIYLEGGVVVIQQGLEVIRAESLYLSLVDDRMVMHDVELRLPTKGADGQSRVTIVRGKKLVRQGKRIYGRDLSVTTSPEAEPGFEIFSGEVEIIEHQDEFEIRSRGNSLVIFGVKLLPLPPVSFFTSDQTQFPIKGASVGFSEEEGVEVQVDLGGSMNDLLSPIHEFFTGRPGNEARGDWELGLGFIQDRGFPIEGALDYRAKDLYRGRTEFFFLNDDGENIRDIRNRIDGSLITDRERFLISSNNRVSLGANTSLDISVWDSGDPAVYSEFFRSEYYEDELPESSVRLRYAKDNFIATVGGRWNLTDFSYDSSRRLTPRFVEELPEATFDLFSLPIADLPFDTPLLLTSSTNVGQFRSNFDKRVASIDDRTFRVDQEFELAAPFRFAGMTFRPFAGSRFTHFSDSLDGGSKDRWAFEAGATLGSRISRSWQWRDQQGGAHALRHVLSPTVRVSHRFKVDGEPTDFHQFDRIDALDENANIRIGLLQRFQTRTGERGSGEINELLWLDLAQNITPISGRDNAGHSLGLFEFEAILRPSTGVLPLPTQFVFEGEQDWNRDELRTFNAFLQVEAGATYHAGYRTDQTERGSIGYGVSGTIRGHWQLNASSQYDLERKQSLNYNMLLTRMDPSWNISVGIEFDNVSGETSFRINFEPTLGGLFETRDQRRARSGALYGGGANSSIY